MGGVIRPTDVDAAAEALGRAGFLAPEAEAAELAAAAADAGDLHAMVERRCTGEPLPWITGTTTFCGEAMRVDPGVYVPRLQTQPMAEAAVAALPADGLAVDLCTGSGAIAVVLARHRPDARILGIDLDPAAVRVALVQHGRADGDTYIDFFFSAELPPGAVPVIGEPDRASELVWAPLDALPDDVIPVIRNGIEALRRGESYTEYGW